MLLKRFTVVASLAVAALLSGSSLSAQEMPSARPQPVRGVELAAARHYDGPPVLILLTEIGKMRPADGTYVGPDRKTIVAKDGRIVGLSNLETGLFQVASAESYPPRQGTVSTRLLFKDSRGRQMSLPDGTFTTRDGMTLVVREAAIVAYGRTR